MCIRDRANTGNRRLQPRSLSSQSAHNLPPIQTPLWREGQSDRLLQSREAPLLSLGFCMDSASPPIFFSSQDIADKNYVILGRHTCRYRTLLNSGLAYSALLAPFSRSFGPIPFPAFAVTAKIRILVCKI